MKKKIAILTAAILVLFASIAISVKLTVDKHIDDLEMLTINNIDLLQVENGVYSGSYDGFIVSASVIVAIENHTIADIVLVNHNNGKELWLRKSLVL